ncbi:uncharacterized protein LOC143621878 [Bidens hawaiensis]|uniref:uncharacterized protein LOC143621878 n=1 Tax=Bidens hawaiensis TaxID=980011 RepID=UPI00404A97EB
MGGKVDSSINRGNAPFVFKLSGENYHAIGSLLPTDGSKPKFSQLYIYDTENEVANRHGALGRYLLAVLHILISEINNGSTSSSDIIDLEIIQDLKVMLDSHNELVKSYRMARDCFKNNPHADLKIRLIAKRQQDGRTYNLPTASEVAALIVGDIDNHWNLEILLSRPNQVQACLMLRDKIIVYTVEFQKCGLPHAHLCLFMHADHKLPTVNHIDPFISAELPDKVEDPELYYLVKEFMNHSPCGIENMNCPCIIDGKCSKKFPKKFREFTSIGGEGYPVYKRRNDGRFVDKSNIMDACYAYGLLDDDNEYIEAISEASFTGSGSYLRSLFVTMLMSESISRPEIVWERTWNYLSDDILFHQRILLKNPGLVLNEQQLKNLTLFELEKFLLRNNSSLKRFSTMPFPDHESISSANNLLFSEELAYDKEILAQEFAQLFSSLTDEQRLIYEEIITSVGKNKGGVFFVYGYGGTGKTFLWKTLFAFIRSEGKIVLSVASSGIASLLLSGGRTAHSRFPIPINLVEDSLCYIKPDSDLARLLHETSLIIWDEAPMIHKHGFEASDRSLKDIFSSKSGKSSDLPFGGKVIVFGGAFRQILPVVPGGSRQQIVNASLSSSYIWMNCKVLKLTKNLRLIASNDSFQIEQTRLFANWLLDIGEGNVGGPNTGEAIIKIPEDLLIKDSIDPISDLIEFVYPSILDNFQRPNFFHERAILTPKNDVVHEINERLLSLFPGDEREYLSSDSICPTEMINENLDESLCSPNILNGFKASGLPNHRLVLKVGVPVMLLRNIDPKSGLCNGTQLKVVSLGNRVIQVEIISGSNIGERHYIPRITLIPTNKKLHIKLQRRQLPLALYVALSRVTRRDGLKILILDSDDNLSNTTLNVVYKEILEAFTGSTSSKPIFSLLLEACAPKIDNPKCESAPGCGEWRRPLKRNPAYKGKWYAPLIDNPACKGIWKPREIPNPDYFKLEKPNFEPSAAIGIEIWTMQDGILFDNILIAGGEKTATEIRDTTWKLKLKLEEEKQNAEEQAAAGSDGLMGIQKTVFDVLCKLADLSFLGDHKDTVLVRIEKAEKQPKITIGVIISVVVVIVSALLKLSFGGKKAAKKVNVAPAKKEEAEDSKLAEGEEKEEEKSEDAAPAGAAPRRKTRRDN